MTWSLVVERHFPYPIRSGIMMKERKVSSIDYERVRVEVSQGLVGKQKY